MDGTGGTRRLTPSLPGEKYRLCPTDEWCVLGVLRGASNCDCDQARRPRSRGGGVSESEREGIGN
jgi:hypothetical protein